LRAAEVAIRLQQLVVASEELESALAHAEHRLPTTSESARTAAMLASAHGASGRAGKRPQLVARWVIGLGALAVLAVPVGIRTWNRPPIADAARVAPAPQPASTPPVASPRPAEASQSAAPAPVSLDPLPTGAAQSGSAPALTGRRPTESSRTALSPALPDRRPARAVRPPEGRGVTARRSNAVASRGRTRGALPQQAGSANAVVAPFVGILAVESEPTGAAVFVDRRHVGETPLELTEIRAGSHAVRIERPGYRPWTASVVVPAGERTRVSTVLHPVGPYPIP
jgi:hypothetical protein